jgi:23S rRNA pseudouridine1911/1915/1917 synthase
MTRPTHKLTFTAAPDDAGKRLDVFLAAAADDLSRSRLKALILDGAVTMDGAAETNPKKPVVAGAEYAVAVPEPVAATPEPQDIPLDVLFEDEHLIVINKPSGMAVHPAPGSHDGTLVNALLFHCQGQLSGIGGVERPGIVHRIDKLTTGVLVAAKTEPAHLGLSALFSTHDIERAYLAVTRGAPRPSQGTVDEHLARSSGDRKKMAVVKNPEAGFGRHAVTHYKTLETFGIREKGTNFPLRRAGRMPAGDGAHAPDPRSHGAYRHAAGRRSGLWPPQGRLGAWQRAGPRCRLRCRARLSASGPARGGAGLHPSHNERGAPVRSAPS